MFTFLKRFFGGRQEENLDPDLIIEESWLTDFRKPAHARFLAETGESYSAKPGHQGLALSLSKKNVYAWTINPLYRYRDFILEALIEFPEPAAQDQSAGTRAGSMAAGFLFRYISDSTFYSVLVSDRGLVRMDAVINGTPVPVLGWTETKRSDASDGSIDDESESMPYQKNRDLYSLRLIVRGTTVTIILNDAWVAECTDDTIQAAGKIAFAAQNWAIRDFAACTLKALSIDSRPMEVETVFTRWNQYMRIPPEAHISLAQTWYAMGKYVPAIIELKRAWKNHEPGTEELLLSAQVYLAQRLLPEAETQVRKALSLDQSHEQAAADLGGILYLQNRFVELDDLIKSLSADAIARSAFLSNLSGHLAHWKGDSEAAAMAYRQAARLAPDQGLFSLHEGKEWLDAGKTAEAVEAWLEAARTFLAAENYADLEAVIPLLETYAPDDMRVQATAGKYLYAAERQKEALAKLELAVKGGSADSAVWYLYGMILSGMNRTDEAIDALRKAIVLESNYGPYHFRLAETLYFADRDCQGELEKALETNPDNGWAHNLAALKALGEKNLDEAETHIREASRLLGNELPILVNFGEIMRQKGRLNEVLPLLDTDDPSSLRAGANLLVADGRHEEAEEWYLRALRQRPFDGELLTDRAANCLELDLLNEADDLLGRAIEIEPTARVYRLIAFLAGRKGEHARAEVALQQGLSEYPEDPDLLYDLSAFYLGTNRPEKAGIVVKRLQAVESSERLAMLEADITDGSTVKVTCSACDRLWRVPKDIPPQGSLHLTAEPPDELPAGTCPSCGDAYCIGCARENLGDDGRFRCKRCGVPLKLIDQNIIWLLNRWQANREQAETD